MTYDKKYNSEDYYWGKKPSSSALNLLKHIQPDNNKKLTLLDLGCGEGRNSVYFAKNNFKVTAIDLSQNGLDKTKKLADENNVTLLTELGDIRTICLTEEFDVIFSSGTLHYLPLEIRQKQISYLQKHTKVNGINCMNVFVEKPFIKKAPDAEDSACLFKSGELLGFYADWENIFSEEKIFECNSGGTKHRHAMNSIIAKKR